MVLWLPLKPRGSWSSWSTTFYDLRSWVPILCQSLVACSSTTDFQKCLPCSPLCQMWCPTSQAMFAFLTFSILTYHYLSSDPSWPSGKKCSHNGHGIFQELWVRFGSLVLFCSPKKRGMDAHSLRTWHFNVFQCVKKSCGWLRNPAPHLELGKPYINVINIDKHW